ncbi:MAG TPA: alpha-glucan family phosphorylase [Polyangiaceae bacterium]
MSSLEPPPVSLPELPETPSAVSADLHALAELAFDLQSAWNHEADPLWEAIAPELWRESGNPWLVYQSASQARLADLIRTPGYRDRVHAIRDGREAHRGATSWFDAQHGSARLGTVAYFSLEFALTEALPLYSGGLGNVAGDYLKAADDLGIPMVGVGLLYQQGYFRQTIDAGGAQRDFFPFNDTRLLPITPVRNRAGEWVRVRLPRPGPPVWLRAWGARLGRTPLYLLDSNDPENSPADRAITSQLYGGDPEIRILQEMTLGLGGWRMLRALGLSPSVCHLNEGHAGFVALERARDFKGSFDVSFEVALAATRPGNVFTTHTPVAAGFDRFPAKLMETQLAAYARDELGIPFEQLLALGRAVPGDASEPFNMAWLAARASGAINAVSRRHALVSRKIFAPLFARVPEPEVPVGYVTNGIHVPSWDSAEADALWTMACGAERWRGAMEGVGKDIAAQSDAAFWQLRSEARDKLVRFVRDRLVRQLAAAGTEGATLEAAANIFNPDALTIGFARRFAAYKRPTLLLRDADRFARLLQNTKRPVQIVVAGKAHPQDLEGKGLVAEWVRFIRRPDLRAHAVFLSDYDLRMAEHLVQGVDLWINTPRPPWEACGTSGMKVLVNGGLNASFRDGWWDEAFTPEVGWAPKGDGHDDGADAVSLYECLEHEVVPAFYERSPQGLPTAWITKMRASMAGLTPDYSANRAVREYCERYYLEAADLFSRRSANGAAGAEALVGFRRDLELHWHELRFGEVHVATEGGRHRFSAALYVGELDPDGLSVELYADPSGTEGASRISMTRRTSLIGARGFTYEGDVPDRRPAAHYTPRVVPARGRSLGNLELPFILWAR